ncbi:MAG TPA: alpha/beta hydrolase [Acidimicrobiales bacterium]|jgi:pimeloyl-ACP methyl ester carboxylesterase
MRPLEAARAGHVDQDGVRVHWEVFGAGDPTIVLLPTWSIVHSRHWKFQVPFLARHHRLLTFDGRGCGRSGRPEGAAFYRRHAFTADTRAVMDATRTDEAVLVSFSAGALWALQMAVDHPARVLGLVTISPAVPLASLPAERTSDPFEEPNDDTDGWAKYNRHYWERDYRDFLDFFFGRMFTEPHSTKAIEDGVGWGLETDPATLADTHRGLAASTGETIRSVAARVRQPVLVIHGDDDAVRPYATGVAVAELTGGSLVTVAGGGHAPHCRHPVVVNRLIQRFVDTVRR